MIVSDAKYENGWLMLKTSAPEAIKQLYSFKAGKDYDLKLHVEKRSRNANAYSWVLITKLAEELGMPKEEVYRHAIEDIGGKTAVAAMKTCAVKDFSRAFIAGHLGRKVEILHQDEIRTDIVLTYGSSDFNTKQMAQLIDSLVQDCQTVGIETKSEEEINSLLKQFEEEIAC